MKQWTVKVGDQEYDVDAPDEQTAWIWANQYHQNRPKKESNLLMDALNYIPSLGDAAARGVIGAGSRALTGAQALGGGLSSLVGREEEAAQRFKAMENRQRSTEQFLKETFPDTGTFREKLVGGAAQIPSYINPFIAGATILGTGIEEQQQANQLGVDPETAKRAGYIGSIGNAAMMALPGAGAVKGALVGGGTAFAGEQAQVANLELSGYEKAAAERKKEVFDATLIGAIIGGGVGGATRPSKPTPKSKPVEETINNLKALNEQKEQQAQTGAEQIQLPLFDQPEMGRVANPYEAALGDWRVDENGIPVKVDLSMEAQNLQDPLQRNLFGIEGFENVPQRADELPPKMSPVGQSATLFDENGMQMAPRNLTEAIDIMDPAAREEAIRQRMMGPIESGELSAAVQAANMRPLTAETANPSLYSPGGPQIGVGPSVVRRDATTKQMESIDRAWESTKTKPFVPKGQRGALDIAQIKEGFKPLYRALSRLTDQAWVKQKFPASEYQTNPDGTPLIMLHGTSKQYDKINVSPEGIHLGFVVPSHLIFTTPGGNPASIGLKPKSWSKATEYPTEPTKLYRNFAKDNITRIRGGANIRPYTIKKGNYPELPFDFGSWDPRMVIPEFYVKSGQKFIDYLVQSAQEKNLPTSKNRFDFLLNRAQSFGYDSKERASVFNQALKEAGIDGFFYKNKHETLNVADDRYASAAYAKSFVTWNPNNVKNVYEGGPSNFVPKGQRGAVDPDLLGITKALNMFSNAKTQISRAVDSAFSSMEFPKSPDELKAESFKAIPGMKDTPYVAKDPIFENEKPNILAEGKDGGRFWFMTPGRLMAQELRNSNLIKTVGRLFENARNRAAYYNRTVLEPIKREVKRISANDNEVILLRDIMHMELKNGKPFTPDELLASGVSPELSGVLQKMRAAYADVLAKENAARVEAGLKPITALDAFYASRWVGPWTAEVRLKAVGEDGKPYSKLVYFIRERSKGSLNNAIEWVKQKHPELEIINNGYDKNYSLKKGRIEAGYEAMLQILGPEDPLIKDIDAWMKERATQTTENVLGQEKHFKAKSGKLGYAGSRPWVDAAKDAREFLNQQLQYIENGYIWSENQAALREMKKYTSDADILDQQPNNVKYVKELAKLELGQGTLKEIDALENLVAKGLGGNTGFGHMAVGVAKSIFYLKAMGLSTPYIVVSLLQPALVLPPALIYAKGSFKDAIPALSDGPYVLARTLLDDYNYQNPKLNELADFAKKKKDPFVEEAYRYARDNQVTEVNPLDEIRDPANTSGVPRSIELANKTVGATISLPEIASRSFVYMAFVHGLRNKFDTSTPEGRLQLFEKAAEMTGFVMGVYRKEQKAPIYQRMGMVGNALSTLQTFPLTYMAQGLTYIKEAKKGNPVPLLAFMGTSLMMAGATGLIGLDDATELYNFVKRWILTPSQYAFLEKYPMLADPKGWLVKNTPDWVSYGPVSSLTGTNLYTRTSMGDVVQFGPFESSTTNIIESMFPFVAELYKTGEGAWDIGVGAAKGDMKRIKEGGYAMTPSGLRGLYEETVPGFREGTIIKRPSDLKVKQVDRPLDEAEQRMWGFRSMREQKELDLGFANRTQEELRAKQYKNASDSLLNAIYNQKGIPDAFETWVALGGDPRNLNQVQKRYILNSTATKLQQDAMKARSNSPAERRKAQQAIEILNELQR